MEWGKAKLYIFCWIQTSKSITQCYKEKKPNTLCGMVLELQWFLKASPNFFLYINRHKLPKLNRQKSFRADKCKTTLSFETIIHGNLHEVLHVKNVQKDFALKVWTNWNLKNRNNDIKRRQYDRPVRMFRCGLSIFLEHSNISTMQSSAQMSWNLK